jgi:hypothetical protein
MIERLYLPLIFVRVKRPVSGDIKMEHDQDYTYFKLACNNRVTVFNENHIFDFKGLTQTSDQDMEELLYNELRDFIHREQFFGNNPD